MTKTYCDICGKRIDSQTNQYSVTLQPFVQMTDNPWLTYKEVCRGCVDAIRLKIDELMPLDNDT